MSILFDYASTGGTANLLHKKGYSLKPFKISLALSSSEDISEMLRYIPMRKKTSSYENSLAPGYFGVTLTSSSGRRGAAVHLEQHTVREPRR